MYSLDLHLVFFYTKKLNEKSQPNKQNKKTKHIKKQTHISRHIIRIVLIYSNWGTLLKVPNTKSS